jgi:hypothetical protein
VVGIVNCVVATPVLSVFTVIIKSFIPDAKRLLGLKKKSITKK